MHRPRNETSSKIPKQETVVLRVWEYDFGIPSVDPESLIIMTLLKLYQIDTYTTYASLPLCGKIPSLQHNDVILSKGPELLLYVINEICHEDRIIPPINLTIINNYKMYFMESFAQTFIFDGWLIEENYKCGVGAWFGNAIPYPFGTIYIAEIQNGVREHFERVLHHGDPKEYMKQCYKAAEVCLSDFNNLLKNNKAYFWRDIPTSLDAVIYSYLVIALHMPSEKPIIRNMIQRHERLVQYVQYISQEHYPNTPGGYKYVKPELSVKKKKYMFILLLSLIGGVVTLSYNYISSVITLKLPDMFARKI